MAEPAVPVQPATERSVPATEEVDQRAAAYAREARVITDIGLHVDEGGGAQMAPLFEEPAELDSPEGFLERAARAYPHWTAERLHKGVFGNLRQLPNGKWSWKYDLRAIIELRKF